MRHPRSDHQRMPDLPVPFNCSIFKLEVAYALCLGLTFASRYHLLFRRTWTQRDVLDNSGSGFSVSHLLAAGLRLERSALTNMTGDVFTFLLQSITLGPISHLQLLTTQRLPIRTKNHCRVRHRAQYASDRAVGWRVAFTIKLSVWIVLRTTSPDLHFCKEKGKCKCWYRFLQCTPAVPEIPERSNAWKASLISSLLEMCLGECRHGYVSDSMSGKKQIFPQLFDAGYICT